MDKDDVFDESLLHEDGYVNDSGTRYLDRLPEGWSYLGICGSPGYQWASNGKSWFGGEYENAQIRIWYGEEGEQK